MDPVVFLLQSQDAQVPSREPGMSARFRHRFPAQQGFAAIGSRIVLNPRLSVVLHHAQKLFTELRATLVVSNESALRL